MKRKDGWRELRKVHTNRRAASKHEDKTWVEEGRDRLFRQVKLCYDFCLPTKPLLL